MAGRRTDSNADRSLMRRVADNEQAAISRDLAQKLLSHLQPQDRLVLTLLKVEGLSVAEIGEMVGWTSSKVKMRIHRAKLTFQRVLRRYL